MDFTIEEGILIRCVGTEENIVIPDGVTQIGRDLFTYNDETFKECPNLKSITFPHGLLHINSHTFAELSNKLAFDKVPSKLVFHFHSIEDFITINERFFLANGKIYIKNTLFQEVEIPEGVTTINKYAFYNCMDLVNVKLPNGLKKIKKGAFEFCTSIKKIVIPNSVELIEESAFSECVTLESIKLPEGLTEVKPYTFSGCKNLREINIPDGLTKISENAFQGCTSIESVSIPSGIKTMKKISPILLNLSPCFNDEEMAYIGLYQGDKKWTKWFYQKMDQGGRDRINEVTLKMAEALGKNGKISKLVQDRVAGYMEQYKNEIKPENARKIQSCFGDAETAVKIVPLNIVETIQKSKTRRDSWLGNRGIKSDSMSGVKAVSGADISPVEAALYYVYEYGRQMPSKPPYRANTYMLDFVELNISQEADAVATMLNTKSLLTAINKLKPRFVVHTGMFGNNIVEVPLIGKAFNLNESKFEEKYRREVCYDIKPKLILLEMLPPLARIASPKEVNDLIITAENLIKNWRVVGRTAAIAIRSSLLLSDTKEAINYLDKYHMLDYYAKIRGTTANAIRSSIISDIDLESDGSMTFDL